MMKPRTPPEILRTNELESYLTELIKEIQKELKIYISPEQTKKIASHMAETMTKNGDANKRDLDKDLNFIHQLKIALVTASKLDKHEDLLKTLSKILTEKPELKKKDLKNNPELKKMLGKEKWK